MNKRREIKPAGWDDGVENSSYIGRRRCNSPTDSPAFVVVAAALVRAHRPEVEEMEEEEEEEMERILGRCLYKRILDVGSSIPADSHRNALSRDSSPVVRNTARAYHAEL